MPFSLVFYILKEKACIGDASIQITNTFFMLLNRNKPWCVSPGHIIMLKEVNQYGFIA